MDKLMKLQDGRNLSLSDLGHEDGVPVMVFHGTPSSRYNTIVSALNMITSNLSMPRMRIISVERPGYGYSDLKSDFSFETWNADARQLADHLEMDRFAVIGVSGGGPFAIACAAGLADHITKAAILSSMGPVGEEGLKASSEEQSLLNATTEMISGYIAGIHANPRGFIDSVLAKMNPADRAQISNTVIELFEQSLFEASRRPDGVINDYRLFKQPWGIKYEEITVPIHFWHSDADTNCPIAYAEYFVEKIPNAKLTRQTGLSHYVAPTAALSEVVSFIVSPE